MHKQSQIPLLAELLKIKGVQDIVICPGSRNAPLIQVFSRDKHFKCHSIVDERSAGYVAMGMAMESKYPVAVVTTSGTAALNLAPAMAEAYYQSIPVIALTADRPPEWIDQQDNQSIKQNNIYLNCKASFNLPTEIHTEEDLWYANRIINQAINTAQSENQGPVHINIPLSEPLYSDLPSVDSSRVIDVQSGAIPVIAKGQLEAWNKAEGVLIICGQLQSNEQLNEIIERIAIDSRVVVLAESTSNISGEHVLSNPDLLFQAHSFELNQYKPDLVIYFGGQVISKRIKNYLRSLTDSVFWYLGTSALQIDTFKLLNCSIDTTPAAYFNQLYEKAPLVKSSSYADSWKTLHSRSKKKAIEESKKLPFSDLWVFTQLTGKISTEDILFAGNSSVVRYVQFFPSRAGKVYSNRGTSGIDGCLSTAVGIACKTTDKVIAVLGDLSFVYDSNALWNRNLPSNLKVVVVNNSGGGIFSMIEGPGKQSGFIDFFEAHHPVEIAKIAEAFGLSHFRCSEQETFEQTWQEFYNDRKSALLEIKTESDINTPVFRNFVQNLKRDE